MNKNDPFRIFENADDDFIENLSDSPRLNNIEKERMFKMSMNIYNEMRKNNSMGIEMNTADGVDGVERYNRPKWYKPVMTAAACIVAIIGIAGSAKLIKNLNGNHGVVNQPDIIATQITTSVTTDSDNALVAGTTETTSVTTDVSATTVAENADSQPAASSTAQSAVQQPAQNNAAATTQAANTQAPAETNAPAETTTVSEENRMLVARGQQEFEYACRKYWGFRSGSTEIFDIGEPYYDENGQLTEGRVMTPSYDDNGELLGYLIHDPDINTVDDALAKYYEIFSDRYPDNDASDLFREYNGNVYWRTGQRGSNIFYLGSFITGVEKITDDEIFFTIEHRYDPDIEYYGTGQAVVTETFSVVVQPDGTWKVGQFHLPN